MQIKSVIVVDDEGNSTTLSSELNLALMEVTDVNLINNTVTLEEVDPPIDTAGVTMIWEYEQDVTSINDKVGERFHMIVWEAK